MSAKCLLTRDLGAGLYLEYSTAHPEPTWAEQNLNDLWNAFVSAIKGLVSKSKISLVSLSINKDLEGSSSWTV